MVNGMLFKLTVNVAGAGRATTGSLSLSESDSLSEPPVPKKRDMIHSLLYELFTFSNRKNVKLIE